MNTNNGNKKGRKQAIEIIPSYQTRKREFKPRTIKHTYQQQKLLKDYLKDMIYRHKLKMNL
jgi:hypothetical protein